LPEHQKSYIETQHKIGNLQLLVLGENQEKIDTPFEEWIQSRNPDYCTENLIPQDKDLYRIEAFPKFLEERNKLIAEKLRLMFNLPKPQVEKEAVHAKE
jgi:hypothetical protein